MFLNKDNRPNYFSFSYRWSKWWWPWW